MRTAGELICVHLTSLLRRRASALLGVQEVQSLIEGVEAQAPALTREALTKVPLPLLTDVLKKLLSEAVSVRNLRAILDALVAPSTEGDAQALAEKCRQARHSQISHQYAPSGPLYAFLVDPGIEGTLRTSKSAIEPKEASEIIEGVKRIAAQGRAVLLASPDVRRLLRRWWKKLSRGRGAHLHRAQQRSQVRPVGRLVAATLSDYVPPVRRTATGGSIGRLTRSFSSLPARKSRPRLGFTGITSPVFGLRPRIRGSA